MKTEIAKQENTGLPAYMVDATGFDFGETANKDIRLPKIFLEQANSPLVAEGKTRPGNIVESFEKRVLGGGKDKPVVLIPYFQTLHWAFYCTKADGGKLHHYEERKAGDRYEKMYEAGNLRDGIEFKQEDGTMIKLEVHRAVNLHCLVKGEPLAMPFAVMFKKSSYSSAGINLQTKARILAFEKKSIPMFNWALTSELKKNDRNETFWIFNLDVAKDAGGAPIYSTEEEYKAAIEANKQIVAALRQGQSVDMTEEFEADEVISTPTTQADMSKSRF